eukprot:CAMPEP_0113484046 /NCGR_PEP_ID=MMETSP0014_2-20120614/23755_1 /TAXON_ID=2857 /ORGANISM="Nitzschia sp." /LENGTH=443 /DNA_ID=CAMNT_0000377627 /DNA_START=247 /DNA_END=1575 /DNA_ORIENTATION=+ /assembly_acc=CAM_ASM_000159
MQCDGREQDDSQGSSTRIDDDGSTTAASRFSLGCIMGEQDSGPYSLEEGLTSHHAPLHLHHHHHHHHLEGTNMDTNQQRRRQRVITMEQISRELFQPDPRVASIEKGLPIDRTVTSFPWKLDITGWSTAGQNDNENENNNKDHNDTNEAKDVLPSYLDLRRQQNLDYVQSCTDKASTWIGRWRTMKPGTLQYENEFKMIKSELIKALELIPDDVKSLLLYSQILLEHDISSFTESSLVSHTHSNKIEKMTKKVLKIDPGNIRANVILEESERWQRLPAPATTVASNRRIANARALPMNILSRPTKQGKAPSSSSSSLQLTARDSSAFQDALMERNLLEGTGMMHEEGDEDNDDSSSADDSESGYDRRKRKRCNEKREKKRKKKKSRKHEYYYNDCDDDDDDEEEEGRRRKRSRKDKKSKKRKKKKKKKRSERSDDGTSSSASG